MLGITNYVNEDRTIRQNIKNVFNFRRIMLETFFRNDFSSINMNITTSPKNPNKYTYQINEIIYKMLKDENSGLVNVLDELSEYNNYLGQNAYDKNVKSITKLFTDIIEYRTESENFGKKDEDEFNDKVKLFELSYLVCIYFYKVEKYNDIKTSIKNKINIENEDQRVFDKISEKNKYAKNILQKLINSEDQIKFVENIKEFNKNIKIANEYIENYASQKIIKKLIDDNREESVVNEKYKVFYNESKKSMDSLLSDTPDDDEDTHINPNLETEDAKVIKLLDKVKHSICSIIAVSSQGIELGASQGSGWYIGNNRVITNAHVVSNMNLKEPFVFDIIVCNFVKIEKKYQVVAIEKLDINNDIAVLNIQEDDFIIPHSITLAAGDGDVIEGMRVYTYGEPLSKGVQFSEGRVTMVSDQIFPHFIRTNMSIKSGNSGGPLFNTRGEVIGMVTAVHNYNGEGIDDFSLAVKLENIKSLL